jgi:hypothetical protein
MVDDVPGDGAGEAL